MKLLSVFSKSLKEQIRNYWILLLTIFMAPFFVFVYYLIIESSEIKYDILVVNRDAGTIYNDNNINFGNNLIQYFIEADLEQQSIPLDIQTNSDKANALKRIKSNKSDIAIIIPYDFSRKVLKNSQEIEIEFLGDMTSSKYMISVVWSYEILSSYLTDITTLQKQFIMKETAIGKSGSIDEFQSIVPGLLILSVIMLMFSASIAIITEVENKTMIRLKLSKLKAWEYLCGVSGVQIILGIIAIYLTLLTAVLLGFDLNGSIIILSFVAILTSISIVGFSLIIAALTKSANEILIAGNFPLFLFMFFTGAAFPIEAKPLFHILNYPISLQGLMSPTHAIAALKKVLIMNMNFVEIVPELVALTFITTVYFGLGIWIFNKRHMSVN